MNVWEQPDQCFPVPCAPGRCHQPAHLAGLFLAVLANSSSSSATSVLTQVGCGFVLSNCDYLNTACRHFPPRNREAAQLMK